MRLKNEHIGSHERLYESYRVVLAKRKILADAMHEIVRIRPTKDKCREIAKRALLEEAGFDEGISLRSGT